MKKYNIIGAAILTLGIMSCGDEKQPAQHEHSGGKNQESAPSAPQQSAVTAVQLKNDQLNAVYQHYAHLTNALVKEDAPEARIAANALETGAKQINGGAAIAASASNISASGDIKQQRSEYSRLSNEMIKLVKQSGLTSGELYVDYCPMAMNDSGAYWLSNKAEIVNPYFGDKMLTCGEVKETIK